MKIRYEGLFDAVEVPVAGVVVRRGVTVDVDSRIAEQLLEQSGWKRPARKKTKKAEG